MVICAVCIPKAKSLNRKVSEWARFAEKPNGFNDLSELAKLMVEGSIAFARSNPFKHLGHSFPHEHCSWGRHGYANREAACVAGARQRKRNSSRTLRH